MSRSGRPAQHYGCRVVGCDRPHYGGRLCRPHYQRWKRTGNVGGAEIQLRTPTGRPCLVGGCDRLGHTRGLCNAHYLRARSTGSPGSPHVRAKRGQGSGGRWKDRNGYIILSNNGRQMAEHRAVMEQELGRSLVPGETVHHRNGVRDDNRPENLELWVSTQPSGQRVVDVLAWARDVIARYG